MTRAEIIAKLKEAKGPDRNLDSVIHWFFLKGVGTGHYGTQPEYTSSLDAAISLVEREKPGCDWGVTNGNKRHEIGLHAWLRPRGAIKQSTGTGATPAIALVLALIGGE